MHNVVGLQRASWSIELMVAVPLEAEAADDKGGKVKNRTGKPEHLEKPINKLIN